MPTTAGSSSAYIQRWQTCQRVAITLIKERHCKAKGVGKLLVSRKVTNVAYVLGRLPTAAGSSSAYIQRWQTFQRVAITIT